MILAQAGSLVRKGLKAAKYVLETLGPSLPFPGVHLYDFQLSDALWYSLSALFCGRDTALHFM